MAPKVLLKEARNPFLSRGLEKEITFEFFAPESKEVCIAGGFNNWNAKKSILKKGSNGKWQISLKLKPGRYEYRFLVDGNWENDQRPIECSPNAYGSWNNVIEVK